MSNASSAPSGASTNIRETISVRVHPANRALTGEIHLAIQKASANPKLKESDVIRLVYFEGLRAVAERYGLREPIDDATEIEPEDKRKKAKKKGGARA